MAFTRRSFLVGAAGAGIGFGLGALSHQFPLASPHVGPDWAPNDETFVASTCMLCPAHCGIRVRLIDGRPVRIDGNPLHPVSQGGLCPKGRAGLQLLYHPARLKGPLLRVGPPGSDQFKPIGWDEALGRVASALSSAHQPGGATPVEWMVGDVSGVCGELVAGFCGVLGTTRVTVDDYRDGSAGILGMCQGISTPPAFDLAGADLVLSFGAALSEAWWSPLQAARARDAESGGRSPRWIQVDVRLSRTAVGAHQFVAVRPGTFGALALGLAYVIVKEGLYDADLVARQVAGWEDWTGADGTPHAGYRTLVLRHGRPDEVSARTGVPVATLTALAKQFGGARRGVAVWDQTVAWRAGGMADGLAIHALNTLTGRLGRRGGLLVQGPMPQMPGPTEHQAPGAIDLASAPLTATSWPAGADDPKVLFLYHANPVASLPDPGAARQALARVPLVVSFSPFFDESARCAHLILPDHTYLERWQDAVAPAAVPSPVWGVVRPVVKPLQNTRATGDVILGLAARMGGSAAAWARWKSVEDLVHERGLSLASAGRGSAFVDRFRQRELGEVEGRGWWLPHGQKPEEFWQSIVESGGWFDPLIDYEDGAGRSQFPDGRVWMFPVEARERLAKSGRALAEGFLPLDAPLQAPEVGTRDFPLQLVPFRVMTLASGGTPLMPWLLEHLGALDGSAWETWIEIGTETARSAGLDSGQRVRVESSRGRFEATVRVSPGAQPGVVSVPYGLHSRVEGWGEPNGANPLAAVGRAIDPLSGLPDWASTRVRVVRI